nr:MAG TPA: hypothetical protein [Caudoviricetes sp.]
MDTFFKCHFNSVFSRLVNQAAHAGRHGGFSEGHNKTTYRVLRAKRGRRPSVKD